MDKIKVRPQKRTTKSLSKIRGLFRKIKTLWRIYVENPAGVIAIGLALGLSVESIYHKYLDNARSISMHKKNLLQVIWSSSYDNRSLENLVRSEFAKTNVGTDPVIKDCKTN